MVKKNTILLLLLITVGVYGEGFYERAPVDYENGQESNEVSRLQEKMEKGLQLEYDSKHGYLKSVLDALGISVSSQVLVFSKTSLQRKLINPSKPRALYFNDNTYIGWVQNSDVLEIAVTDKNLGAVFYTLDQHKTSKPKFERDDSCLSCHASGRTQNEPGFFLRSVFPDYRGEPISRAGEDRVHHGTPFNVRWGGWYVTAEKMPQTHRGNAITVKNQDYTLSPIAAKSTSDLKDFFDPENYLATSSDIEALLTLEHQVKMHNIFTSTKFRSLHALHNERVINEALGETGRRDLTARILTNAANEILDYMLFVDEISLKKIDLKGNTSFAEDFSKGRPEGHSGNSLFDLDFQNRLSKLPCSWSIYSDSFKGLPDELRELVLTKLKALLLSPELPDKYIHLRQKKDMIHQILMKTHKEYELS
jgi:hypothetical protein